MNIGGGKILRAMGVSLPLSLTVVLLSLALGFFPAKARGCARFRGKRLVELALLLPSLIPQVTVVFGMQAVLRRLGLYATLTGVVLVQLAFHVPYMTLLLSAVFDAYDPAYEQQAACLAGQVLAAASQGLTTVCRIACGDLVLAAHTPAGVSLQPGQPVRFDLDGGLVWAVLRG